MVQIGFFQQNMDPNFRVWVSDENVKYIQKEVARRLGQKYYGYNTVEYDYVRNMIIQTIGTWRGPLTRDELLEMVICNFVQDIDTDIEWSHRFWDTNPRTLYFAPESDITMAEKVKLNPGYKFEFQMRY